jgi:hypothetical protein
MKSRLYRAAGPLITKIQKLFSEDLAKENDFLRQAISGSEHGPAFFAVEPSA